MNSARFAREFSYFVHFFFFECHENSQLQKTQTNEVYWKLRAPKHSNPLGEAKVH